MAPALHLTAAGAFTSLGTLVPAAAAARSGLVNACTLDLAAIEGGAAVRGAAGHAAPGIDRALGGGARLAALLAPAAGDLARALAERGITLGRAGLYLGLPQALDGEGSDDPGAAISDALAVPFREQRLFRAGRAGTSQALLAACQALRERRVEHAIVGGCESKLDPARLAHALACGRLKTHDYPVGFMPGEAAALALLETEEAVAARGRSADALLTEPVVTEEAQSYAAGGPPAGNALAQALTQALAGASFESGSVVVDLNGEAYRATDWAIAMVRARAAAPIDRLRPEVPALWFGDVGAAYPVLAIALAARSFARDYAPGPVALVCTSADAGTRAALLVTRPPT